MEKQGLEREINELYKELNEVEELYKELLKARGLDENAPKKEVLAGLDYTDPLIQLDDDMYIIRRAISELEWKLHVQFEGGGC